MPAHFDCERAEVAVVVVVVARQNTFLFLPVAFLGLHLSNIYAFLM